MCVCMCVCVYVYCSHKEDDQLSPLKHRKRVDFLVRPYLKDQTINVFCFLRRFSFFYWKKRKKNKYAKRKGVKSLHSTFFFIFLSRLLVKVGLQLFHLQARGKSVLNHISLVHVSDLFCFSNCIPWTVFFLFCYTWYIY